jgi:hypothetical protein
MDPIHPPFTIAAPGFTLARMRCAFLIPALLGLTAPQDPEGPGDKSRIDFFYAGQFKEALKKAAAQNRILLVKGVSVVVDDEAARDVKRGTC